MCHTAILLEEQTHFKTREVSLVMGGKQSFQGQQPIPGGFLVLLATRVRAAAQRE